MILKIEMTIYKVKLILKQYLTIIRRKRGDYRGLILDWVGFRWLFLIITLNIISWKDEGKLRKSSFKADETDKTLLENLLNQELNRINTEKVGIYVR